MDFVITAKNKDPPEANEADFNPSTVITVTPPSTELCTDFRDIVVDDNIALEGLQNFTVCVGDSTAWVTIVDDDAPIIESDNVVINEAAGFATLVVRLVNEIESEFSLDYATGEVPAGADETDFVRKGGQIRFAPRGLRQRSIRIEITDDDEIEPNEPLRVSFSSTDLPEGMEDINIPTPTVTIIDDDLPGTIVNDTIIGDPLFTVTLPDEDEFMCYEVHGEAGKYFNLVSDTCLSVNALFSLLPNSTRINRMSEIGIYAKGTSDDCVQIQISLSCFSSVDGMPIDSNYQKDGISIRRYPNRWRVSVPNCGSTQVVMWIFCQGQMLRFHIARGNNLAPTSHGLLAQFWNIPITTTVIEGEPHVQLFNSTHPSYRLIPAFLAPRTWDHTHAPCYYVGNAQGGPSQSHDPTESVIEGKVFQYETAALFSPLFDFFKFDESTCT